MGFEKVILEDGQGLNVPPGATVTVHCTGYGKNGDLKEKFWSTKDPGQEPFTFKIGVGNVSLFWFEMLSCVFFLFHVRLLLLSVL